MADTFQVPLAVQRIAGSALATHRATPALDDVTGVTLAERLVGGTIDADTIGKMYRFFRQNARMYAAETQRFRSEQDSGLVRSWLLHGAEAGQVFAAGLYRQLVTEGAIPEDPLDALFAATPEQVYARFQAGAWRWEYGLTPSSAARFVQAYTEATDQQLELPKAFGDAAIAVGNHIWRRYHGLTPFEQARRALNIDDESLRLAAHADLAAFRDFPLGLVESLNWKTLQTAPARKAAADSWPAWLAYLILAVEAPALLKDLHAESYRPPALDEKPKPFLQYHDALNVWVMYFHPQGRRYHNPDTEETAKKFHGLTATLHDFMVRAWRGKKIQPAVAKKVARVARDWVHLNKPQGLTFAGTFNILIDYWKKGAWQELLDALPEDADVRPAFQAFVQENPMPVGGVELTKKLATDSPDYKAVVAALPEWTLGSLTGTKTEAAAEKQGTPLGVKSVLRFVHSGVKYTVLGAATHPKYPPIIVVRDAAGVKSFPDPQLAGDLAGGTVEVVQAHEALPGSIYNVGAGTKAQIPAVDPKMSGTQGAIEYVLTKVQGTPAIKAEAPEFKHALGAQFQQKGEPSKWVAIAGYARKGAAPLYVLINAVGAFQAVAPSLIHGRYPDGPTAYRDDIVSALKPPPDPAHTVAVTAALRKHLDQSFGAGAYTLIALPGTSFDSAAHAAQFQAKFGQVWVAKGTLERTLAAAVHDTAGARYIVWYNHGTETFADEHDLIAAQKVGDGTYVPQGATSTPSTTDVSKPVIPANAVGTLEAIEFAKGKGYVPVARAHAPEKFKFELGALVSGPSLGVWVILGYARDLASGGFLYAAKGVGGAAKKELVTSNTETAHHLWTGPIGYDEKVIKALISAPAPKSAVPAKPTLPEELLVQDFPDHHDQFVRLKSWGQTTLAKQVSEQHGVVIATDWKFKNVSKGWVFTVVAAYRTPTSVTHHYTDDGVETTEGYGPGTIFVMENPDMDLVWWDSDQLADAFAKGALVPATADDPEILAQQVQQAAAKADAQATALTPELTAMQQAIKDTMPKGTGAYTFIDPRDTESGLVAVNVQKTALAVGSRWQTEQIKGIEILGAATGFLDPGNLDEKITRVYARYSSSKMILHTDDETLAAKIQAGGFWPDTAGAEALTKPPATFPSPSPTAAEKAALDPFPKHVIQALLTPEVSAEEIQLMQAPLSATRWAKAAATHGWAVTKGSVWVWSLVSEEAAEQALTPVTVLGAIGDAKRGYTVLVEEQGEVVAYEDTDLRSKTLTDQLFPQAILPSFSPDVLAALAQKGLAAAQPLPLLHTLFGISAGYMNYQQFVVAGAKWQEQGTQPYALVGAVEGAARNLIILKTTHGKILFKNEMTLADLVELGELEPVDAPNMAPAAFEAPVMQELTATHHVKGYQVGKIDLAQTSSGVTAKDLGIPFEPGSVWRYVGKAETFVLQSAATLPGGQIVLVVQQADGTTASIPDATFTDLLVDFKVLPHEPTALTPWAPAVLDFLKTFDLTAETAPYATIRLQYTNAFAVAKTKQWTLAPESEWVWPHSNTRVAILGAVSINAKPYLVTRNTTTGALAVVEDGNIAADIGKGGFLPASEYAPPKFSVGQVLTWSGQTLRVLAVASQMYLVHRLFAGSVPTVPSVKGREDVEGKATVKADTVSAETFLDLATVAPGFKRLAALPKGWPTPGAPVQIGGSKGVFVGGVAEGASPYAVLLTPKSMLFEGDSYTYDEAVLIAGSLFAPAVTTYAPLVYPPTTLIEYAGIKAAFAWATGQGFTIVAKSESPDFKFHLGEIRVSKDAATRIIVGYGTKGGVAHYIVAEDLNLTKFTQKNAANGNAQYGPPTGLHPEVRKHLLPVPGATPPTIPAVPLPVIVTAPAVAPLALGPIDVDAYFSPGKAPKPPKPTPKPASYGVSARADAWLKTSPFKAWIEPPPDAPFHTYTTGESDQLLLRSSRTPVRILGWVWSENHATAVVDLTPDASAPDAAFFDVASLRNMVFATSPNAQVLGDDEGGVTVAEHPDEPEVTVDLPGLALPHDPGPGWDLPTPIVQEAVHLEPGKDVAAGVVAVLPPNTRFSGGGKTYQSPHPMVLLVHPRNNFSGPLAFPKGRVDKGEGLTRAAVREVWEETGVKVRPVALLRNFKAGKPHIPDPKQPDWTGSTTVTRYYIGYIIGGHPKRYGWEADSVTFKPLTPEVEQTKWFKKLSTRDRRVVQRVIAWLQEHGLPQDFSGEATPFDVQVTDTADAKGQALPAVQADPWLALVQHAPFAVTEPMVASLRMVAGSYQTPQALVAGVSGGPGMPRMGDQGTFEGIAGSRQCIGYVGWRLLDGTEIRGALFQQPDDTVIFFTTTTIKEKWTADAAATAAAKTEAGSDHSWFWHPNTETHHRLQAIHSNGGGLDDFGADLGTVQKWLGEAGVPFAQTVTERDLARVTALFVPRALSKAERDAILQHLVYRAKLGGAVGNLPITTPTGVQGGAAGGAVAPALAVVALPYFAAANKALVEEWAGPVGALEPTTAWKVRGPLKTKDGGSKPIFVVEGPDGQEWVYKPHTELQRPAADRAAYQLSELLKPNNNPVGLVHVQGGPHGGIGSVQPLIEGKRLALGAADTLSSQDHAEIAAQHVVDMFLGDHDGNQDNWMRTPAPDGTTGPLVAIDRGQAFKFVALKVKGETVEGVDPTESLDPFDPTWGRTAPGNFGEHVAKRLLRQWFKAGEIPAPVLHAMRVTLDRLAQVTDAQLAAILGPVLDANALPGAQRKAFLAEYRRRREEQANQWRDVFRKRLNNPTWDWPATTLDPMVPLAPAPKTAEEQMLDRTPAAVGLGPREAAYLADAARFGWAGKSINVDRDAIEDQSVMVKAITGTTPYTLVHWRVPKHAGVRAAKRLYPSAKVTDAGAPSVDAGPQRSKIDDHFKLYWRLRLAVDDLDLVFSSGYQPGVAPPFNEVVFTAAWAVAGELDKLDAATKDAKGWYTVGAGNEAFGEPNPIVQQMVVQYRKALARLRELHDHWSAQNLPRKSGEILGQFPPFTWTDDGTYKPPGTVAPKPTTFQVEYVVGKARWPNIQGAIDGTLALQPGAGAAAGFVRTIPQFILRRGKTEVHFAPPHKDWRESVGAPSMSSTPVLAWEGVCWAMVPGTPSPAALAQVLNLWQAATGIETMAPDPRDREVLYYMKQAQLAQGTRARQMFDAAQGPVFEATFAKKGDLVVVIHRKGERLYPSRDTDPGYTVDPHSTKPRVTVSTKLQPTDRVEILQVQAIQPNPDFEAIDTPELLALWKQYQNIDRQPDDARAAAYAKILAGLREFVGNRLGVAPDEIAAQADVEGQYAPRPVRATLQASDFAEDSKTLRGRLDVPKGTSIAPGTATWRLTVGVTEMWVQDTGKGVLDARSFNAEGKVVVEQTPEGVEVPRRTLNLKTGAYEIQFLSKIRSEPEMPEVTYRLVGRSVAGVDSGGSFRRHLRLGWDRDRMRAAMMGPAGKTPVFVAHSIQFGEATKTLHDFWLQVRKNGALLAQYVRPMYGIPKSGTTPDPDVEKGATGSFAGIRRGVTAADHLYFDMSLLLRTDVYAVSAGDGFGAVDKEVFRTPETWLAAGLNRRTGGVSTSERHQILLRDEADFLTYLVFAVASSSSAAREIIKLCYKQGWTSFWRGRRPEDVIVTISEAQDRYGDVL
jgi:8-oxo-dGTP pyrophosphatase MutT (NUDIX family)